MKYLLLTGATGLLGRYLVRDLQSKNLGVAVLVRPTRFETARQRVETIMARWEREENRALVRPVVLEGDITEPDFGLDQAGLEWLSLHCDCIVHSAARLAFEANESNGEPARSNVTGTRNMLGLCRKTGIRKLHHVSTAYICGLRTDRIFEEELDVGQEPGNVYEETKLAAEKLVRTASFLESVTVYRPSIIVGDAGNGYTNTFHGFYTPMRAAWTLMGGLPVDDVLEVDFLDNLCLTGRERKNLVPVNWVSAAMAELILAPATHGRTYHLTNPSPVRVDLMYEVFLQAMMERYLAGARPPGATVKIGGFEKAFHERMRVYETYWRDDPEFDCRNTQQALSSRSCPVVDREMLLRLARYALECNFGWPRESPASMDYDVAEHLQRFPSESSAVAEGVFKAGLRVSGSGGGQWSLVLSGVHILAATPGISDDCGAVFSLRADVFKALADRQLDVRDAFRVGRVVVMGGGLTEEEQLSILDSCVAPRRHW